MRYTKVAKHERTRNLKGTNNAKRDRRDAAETGSSMSAGREFTAAEVEQEITSGRHADDGLSPVKAMLMALRRRLLREEARRATRQSTVRTFGCKMKLTAAGVKCGARQ